MTIYKPILSLLTIYLSISKIYTSEPRGGGGRRREKGRVGEGEGRGGRGRRSFERITDQGINVTDWVGEGERMMEEVAKVGEGEREVF